MNKNDILFGREQFTMEYNSVLGLLSILLEATDAIEFEHNCNTIYDTIAGSYDNGYELEETYDFSDDNLYPIFKKRVFKLFNDILLKYGIHSEITSISKYKDIFNILVNLKLNEIDRSEYSLIIHGDFSIEDKLYMIFENYCEEPIALIEEVEVSELFFNNIEELISSIRLDVNDEMVLRAISLNVHSDLEYKKTIHCREVLNGNEAIMVELFSSMETVNSIIRANLLNYYNNEDKLVSRIDAIIEIIYTYIFYNKTNMVILTDIVNKDSFSKHFKIHYDNVEIRNILNRITSKLGDKV